MILSKVVLVVIFLLATAQVSAPIDADLESVSQPMAGVVLMLMAGFAPYLTYKAIAFMGFDMYHAMSAEQEAKASLNRPMPIPLSPAHRQRAGQGPGRRRQAAGGRYDGRRLARDRGTVRRRDHSEWSGRQCRRSAGGASGGAAAAGGAVAAGVVVAKEAAAAGPRLGKLRRCAWRPDRQTPHESAAPSTVPPPVADSTLVETAGRK